jgi:F-type H+-transporting ATPase subunit gamma
MATLLDFRRRIRSVKNTQQITRAMKFISAAYLRKAQDAAMAARPYAQELAGVLRSTMARIDEPQHALLAKRPEQNVLVIVLSGERGLAGAFNSNILKKAGEFFRANKDKKMVVVPVGKKGRDSLKRAGFTFAAEYVNALSRVKFSTAREIAELASQLYSKEEVDAVYIIFSEFKTVMTANLVVEKLLPVQQDEEQKDNQRREPNGEKPSSNQEAPVDYIYEQPEEQILGKLLPRYIETQILRAMLESSAAEYAARMTAMESATKNAGDVIEGLTLHMNKVRQAAITKEIIEIVSGASYGA